jgi:hypothetical protein
MPSASRPSMVSHSSSDDRREYRARQIRAVWITSPKLSNSDKFPSVGLEKGIECRRAVVQTQTTCWDELVCTGFSLLRVEEPRTLALDGPGGVIMPTLRCQHFPTLLTLLTFLFVCANALPGQDLSSAHERSSGSGVISGSYFNPLQVGLLSWFGISESASIGV